MSIYRKVLIIGASGYVGRKLFSAMGKERAIATYHSTPMDGGVRFNALENRVSDLGEHLNNVSHAVIMLGETNIDTCFRDREACDRLNVDCIIRIIKDLVPYGIVPVFISTDHVFNGRDGNYTETDVATPIVAYGQQKAKVETFLESNVGSYCVIRLSKVYGIEPGDKTLFSAWYEAIGDSRPICLAVDQKLTPIYVGDVVRSIPRLIERNATGIFHLCGDESGSREWFFGRLLNIIGSVSGVGLQVERREINDLALLEERPIDVTMDSMKVWSYLDSRPTPCLDLIKAMVGNFNALLPTPPQT